MAIYYDKDQHAFIQSDSNLDYLEEVDTGIHDIESVILCPSAYSVLNGVVNLEDQEALNSFVQVQNNILPDWLQNRLDAYGSVTDQLEFIAENGAGAWQEKVLQIKALYPKPVE